MNILTDKYLVEYKKHLARGMDDALRNIAAIKPTPHNFTFYTSVAVISSSQIEGETIQPDSYVKHKMQDVAYLPELVEKPNDLYNAYLFAQKNKLGPSSFLHTHSLISQHLLPEKWRGVYRKTQILVLEHNTGRIQFEAAPFNIIQQEMDSLWQDIEALATRSLSIEEIFYYASFIHLVFVNIHPFTDGNGRAGRLLEKWFLAQCLGEMAWYIRSEKYYYDHVAEYYRNLNRLGMFYEQLDYGEAASFLQMLPKALEQI